MAPRKQGRTARQKAAEAKRRRYAAARAKGKSRKKALEEAGYQPGNGRAAASMAAAIDRKLGTVEDLEAELVKQGITTALIVKKVKQNLNSSRPEVRGAALKLISAWKKWGKASDDKPTTPIGADDPITLAAARSIIAATLEQHRRAGSGPADSRPPAGEPAPGQPAQAHPPSA